MAFALRREGPLRKPLAGSRNSELKYLLGYPNVRNHDGSWTEWGNLVRTPIEKP